MDDKNLSVTKQIKKLTPKNRIFLELLSQGNPILDSYKQAGYNGSNHSAYELKSSLKHDLELVLEAKGFSREGLATELLTLSKLPLMDHITSVTFNQKLQLLRLLSNSLPDYKQDNRGPSHITAFVINSGSVSSKDKAQEPFEVKPIVQDVEEIKEPENASKAS